jgi:hypothetical protein
MTIDWMRELDMENVIFEMHAKVVDGMKHMHDDATEFGAIIKERGRLLSFSFYNSHV